MLKVAGYQKLQVVGYDSLSRPYQAQRGTHSRNLAVGELRILVAIFSRRGVCERETDGHDTVQHARTRDHYSLGMRALCWNEGFDPDPLRVNFRVAFLEVCAALLEASRQPATFFFRRRPLRVPQFVGSYLDCCSIFL